MNWYKTSGLNMYNGLNLDDILMRRSIQEVFIPYFRGTSYPKIEINPVWNNKKEIIDIQIKIYYNYYNPQSKHSKNIIKNNINDIKQKIKNICGIMPEIKINAQN